MTPLAFSIQHFDCLPSTQQYLVEWSREEEVPEGTLVWAKTQTAGKGQEGNHWESEAGKNLTFSFLLRAALLHPSRQFQLNKMVSLAILNTLQAIPGFLSPLRIKWPNDLYAGDKKIGGILINHSIMGDILLQSVVGIGLNVNQKTFSSYCPNPTSVSIETGVEQDLSLLLDNFLSQLEAAYQHLHAGGEHLDTAYLAALYLLDQSRNYRIRGNDYLATIRGVDEFGFLQLETAEAGLLHCDIKEIIYTCS